MSRLIFMVEEKSAKEFLEKFVPRLVPDTPFLCIAHEGKSDLRKSIPRKLAAWTIPNDKFVILHDQDSADCKILKNKLLGLCGVARNKYSIRIVCKELESWYLGDLAAISNVFCDPKIADLSKKSKFSNPENLGYQEFKQVCPEYQKLASSRKIGLSLSLTENRSKSFKTFVRTVKDLASEIREESLQ